MRKHSRFLLLRPRLFLIELNRCFNLHYFISCLFSDPLSFLYHRIQNFKIFVDPISSSQRCAMRMRPAGAHAISRSLESPASTLAFLFSLRFITKIVTFSPVFMSIFSTVITKRSYFFKVKNQHATLTHTNVKIRALKLLNI